MLVIGEGTTLVAEMDSSDSVDKLRELVYVRQQYTFPVTRLSLFVADDEDDGRWLRVDESLVRRLRDAELPPHEFFRDDREMIAVLPLSHYFAVSGVSAPQLGQIHVLAVPPPKPNAS